MSSLSTRQFTQTTSLIRTFRLAVLGLASLLLLELLGSYLSNRSFLERISEVHEVQRLSNTVSVLRQITDSLGVALRRPEPGPEALRENVRVYTGIYRQALATLLSDWSVELTQVRDSLVSLNEAATSHYAEVDPRDRTRDLLIAEQFDSDAAETLDKLKLTLSRRADEGFQAAYGARYRPLLVSLVFAAASLVICLAGGLHLITRLQTGVLSLIAATREAASGNMEVRAPILTHDEIGALAYSFNEMAAALKNRDEFLSIASHELKTPVTSFSLRLQMLVREVRRGAPLDRLESLATGAERESRRLADLLEGLLDLTRIRLGQLRLERKRVDLGQLAESVAQRFALETRELGISLSVKAPGQVAGYWDPVRVDQVLSNLVSNAIKYGNRQPINVIVENDLRLRAARVIVQDHGMGIPGDMLERIFDRYERVENAAVRRIAGFGLGLYVSRQIVRSHGGDIRVESKVGEGSTFIVELPWRSAELDQLPVTA